MIDSDTRKTKVYLTNAGGHDFNPAKKYGELISLTKGNINPLQIDRIIIDMGEILRSSSPDDYLLLSGHPVTVMVATSMLISLHGRVRVLVWNKHEYSYNARLISKSQILSSISA